MTAARKIVKTNPLIFIPVSSPSSKPYHLEHSFTSINFLHIRGFSLIGELFKSKHTLKSLRHIRIKKPYYLSLCKFTEKLEFSYIKIIKITSIEAAHTLIWHRDSPPEKIIIRGNRIPALIPKSKGAPRLYILAHPL